MQEPEFFTIAEVARMLKVSPDTVSRCVEHEPGVIDFGLPERRHKEALSCAQDSRRCFESLPPQEASSVTESRKYASNDNQQETGQPKDSACHNLPMCGRYRLSRRKQLVEEYFDSISDEPDWSPRFNVAPTQPVPVIRQNPKEPIRELSLMKWGLIPAWAKDASGAARMINARSETASSKPAFRDSLKSCRCLIPADGFYEWARTGKSKRPYCFEVNEGELFAFAGLWDRWKDPSGNWIKTCSIITTTPNAVTSTVHNRMPVILEPDSYDLWLDPGMRDVSAATDLLKPHDARLMRCYPVSTRINSVANDDEECSRPVEITEAQTHLFS